MFVYTLKLNTNNQHHQQLERRFKMAQDIYRTTLFEILKRVKKQSRDPRNKTLKQLYRRMSELNPDKLDLKKLPKDVAKEIKAIEAERKDIYKQLDIDYDLRGNFSFGKFANNYRNARNYAAYIPSDVAIKLGFRAWAAYEKVKFNKGSKRVNTRALVTSFEANKDSAIIIRDGILKMGTKHAKFEVPVIYRNDEFEQEVLRNTFKYNRVVRRFENGKWQYYVQMVFDGIPPQPENTLKGTVGIDIGVKYVSIATPYEVDIIELAPNLQDFEPEIRRLQRKMDRQRRANNPANYNEDGTIKRGPKTWVDSKRYLETKNKLADLKRRQAETRKLAHKTLANKIAAMGDKFIIRHVNYDQLAQRSSKTELTKAGTFKSKARAGKQIANTAPAYFIEQLAYKAAFQGKEVVKVSAKEFDSRSFDHVQNDFVEVDKNAKTRVIGDHNLQTNLYSAFALANLNDNLQFEESAIDFDTFLRNHDHYIDTI